MNRRLMARTLALWLLVCSVVVAAEPDDVLRRLVAADAGLCVEISGLKHHWPELVDSEITKRLRQTAAFRRWLASADYRKLREAEERLQGLFGRPAGEFFGDLFGHSVVLAIYPSPGERAAGVLLVHAANDLAIREAVDVWNAAEAAELVSLSHAGQTYVQRTRPRLKEGPRAQFYWTSGAVLALSDDEAMIRRVVDLASSPSNADSLLALPEYRRAAQALPHSGPVWAWFNPRAWDHAVNAGGEAPQRLFAALWSRCESIAVSLRLESGLVVEAVAHYDERGLPDQLVHVVRSIAGPAEFLERVPRRALLAAVGRHGFAALDQWLSARLDSAPRGRAIRQVGRGLLGGLDPATDLLSTVEPDWGAYLVPRERSVPDAIPVDAVVALKLSPAGDESSSMTRSAIDGALRQALAMLAAFHNVNGPDVAAIARSQPRETGVVHWIEGIDQWQPAAALTADALILGSSPRAVTEFMDLQADESLASWSEFHRWKSKLFAGENQIAFLNLGAVRTLLESHREFFIAHSARSESISETEAQARLAELEDLLAAADGAFVAASLGEQKLRLVCGLAVHESAADAEGPPHQP